MSKACKGLKENFKCPIHLFLRSSSYTFRVRIAFVFKFNYIYLQTYSTKQNLQRFAIGTTAITDKTNNNIRHEQVFSVV